MSELTQQTEKTLEHIHSELAGIRGGRAHPALVEELHVSVYGSSMRLRDIASITVPEARVIEIRLWDAGNVGAVASALEQSDLGTMPNIAGEVIRIALPPLTDARRAQLAKVIGSICEEGRVALRNMRDSAIARLKQQEKSGAISEDDLFRQKDEIEETIKQANTEIERLRKAKEEEITET